MGITHSWNGTILTITSDSGTSSADLKGDKGDDGARGAQGARGLDGINGKDGKDANIDLSTYATIDYVEETVANIEHPTVDFTGYATEDYVDRAIEELAIGEVDLSSYATKQYVDDAVANVDVEASGLGGVELTQAEYDALPQEDKQADIVYFIKDGEAKVESNYKYTTTVVPCNYFGTELTVRSMGGVNKLQKYTKPNQSLSAKTTYELCILPQELRPTVTRYMIYRVMVGTVSTASFVDVQVQIGVDGVVKFIPFTSLGTDKDCIFEIEWFSEQAFTE